MEIIGVGLIVVILAAVFAALMRIAAGRDRPPATKAGERAPTGSSSPPTVDRPAGPAAETNMGPGPGVLHPDSQHDANGHRAPGGAPGPSEGDHSGPESEQGGRA